MKIANSKGFTLVEIAIVIMIVGILMIPILRVYEINRKQQLLAKEKEKITDAASALSKYVLENSRYPCPADMSIDQNNINYGREVTPCPPPLNNPNPATCNAKICKATGRDRHTASAGGDNVLIGTLPFAELGLSVNDVVDIEGDQLTYAVSERLVDTTTFDNYYGAINVTDEFGATLTNGAGDPGAHFVVLSHGKNRKGAISSNGTLIAACAAPGRDVENCNRDATFMQGKLWAAEGVGYFDDYVQYRTTLSSGLWSLTGGGSTNIMNTNVGNIGLGTASPSQKLDVNGNIRVAGKTITNQICDSTGANCFNAVGIGGNATNASRITCPAGQVIQGFASGGGTCVTPSFTSSIPTQNCPAATPYVKGLRSDGTIVCGN